jgi:hypothetical protein
LPAQTTRLHISHNNKQAIQLLHCRQWLFICKIAVNSLANHPLTSTSSTATSLTSFPLPATPQIILPASGNTKQSLLWSHLSTKTPIWIIHLYSGILTIIEIFKSQLSYLSIPSFSFLTLWWLTGVLFLTFDIDRSTSTILFIKIRKRRASLPLCCLCFPLLTL